MIGPVLTDSCPLFPLHCFDLLFIWYYCPLSPSCVIFLAISILIFYFFPFISILFPILFTFLSFTVYAPSLFPRVPASCVACSFLQCFFLLYDNTVFPYSFLVKRFYSFFLAFSPMVFPSGSWPFIMSLTRLDFHNDDEPRKWSETFVSWMCLYVPWI